MSNMDPDMQITDNENQRDMVSTSEGDQSDEPLVMFFLKHLVGISITLEKDEKPIDIFISAFVISVRDFWFLITAAHYFSDSIKKFLDNGYVITRCYLVDSLSDQAKHKHPICVNYSQLKFHLLKEFESDLDLAYMFLSPLYRKLMEINQIEPFDETTWSTLPEEFDAIWVFGFPSEFNNSTQDKISIRPAGFQVNLLQEKPAGFSESNSPRIYGKINTDGVVASIRGMSGGPLLGFKRVNGVGHYWLIGVQSSWLPESHIIEAMPFSILGATFIEVFDELKNEIKTII